MSGISGISDIDVLKFGGSTFRTPADFPRLAKDLAQRLRHSGRTLVVVVSAMPGETEALRGRLSEIVRHPSEGSVAGLLTLADTVAARLLAACLEDLGLTSRVLAGHQQGITTEGSPMWARIAHIAREPLRSAARSADVVIVPGGQAQDADGTPTWLGKNSSDLTAVALAVAAGAATCEIHSDVDGVYTCDPHLVPDSTLMSSLSYEHAERLSGYGAKVLHRDAVALAREHGITIHCRSNRAPYAEGTVISSTGTAPGAVVLNRNSTALRFPSTDRSEEAARLLNEAGITAFPTDTDAGPCVVVAGGYVDIDATFSRLALTPGVPVGIPVIGVGADHAVTRLAADAEASVVVARQLHHQLANSFERTSFA
ncbi:aspartate kinase [Streptomyces sp. NPDC002082]|uniref:amino acid kinase family protein n=1 Tax=Streptomyces sp. NPDC002082 TaxID=3154772 RepID=UPI0033248B2A